MKTAQQHATADEHEAQEAHESQEARAENHDQSNVPKRPFNGKAAPLPLDADQSGDSQQEPAPRGIGKQENRDLERGLEDADQRGGGDYQERTRIDSHANEHSAGACKRC